MGIGAEGAARARRVRKKEDIGAAPGDGDRRVLVNVENRDSPATVYDSNCSQPDGAGGFCAAHSAAGEIFGGGSVLCEEASKHDGVPFC